MSKEYKGARYLGEDEIHLPDGSLIAKGEVTKWLSEEAALNDNNFEAVYSGEKKKDLTEKPKIKKPKKGGKK